MGTLSTLQLQIRRRILALPSLARFVLEPALLLLLAVLLIGATLLYGLPLKLPVPVGQEEGKFNDAPFVHGFNGPELIEGQRRLFRWSSPQAALRFPNIPDGLYQLTTSHLAGGPARLIVNGAELHLPAASTARRLLLLIPTHQQALELGIQAQPTINPADRRSLGLAITGGQLSRIVRAGIATPWRPVATAAVLLLFAWLVPRGLGAGRREALAITASLTAALLMAIAFDPLRMGLAPRPLLLASLYGLGALALLLVLLPAATRHLGMQLDNPWRRWLLLATLSIFILTFVGRTFPASMEGDIGFHYNRFTEVVGGRPLLISRHRGIDFPYPPALYLLLMPLSLLVDPFTLLQAAAATLTALMLPALYLLMQRVTGSQGAALASALLYALFPATYMPIWWSFDTHVFAQWTALITSAFLVWNWGRLHSWRIWLGLLFWLMLVFLGHFGFFLNTSLLLGLLVMVGFVWKPAQRPQLLALALALGSSVALACLLFYSAYADLFREHLQAFSQGGMNAVNNRRPVPASEMLRAIAVDGFWRHYALLPLLAAPPGLLLLLRMPGRGRTLALVAGATFCTSLAFGSLPLLTSSTISTRWLVFSAWALAACGGVTIEHLWRREKLSRLLAVGTMLFVGWWGLRLWLLAMVYYVRPPEPF